MLKLLKDCHAVLWADLRVMRHLWPRYLVTSMMTPLLYLLAFGFGLGRVIQVEGSSYLRFVIPGIVALTAMNVSYGAAGTKLNVDRLYYKCFDEILMAPVSPFALIFGKSLIGVVRGLAVSTAILLIGIGVAGIQVSLLLALTLVASCFAFAFLGVLAALLARSHQDMATFSSVVLTPMTFLGGTFFSAAEAPIWLKALLAVMPLAHVSRCLRAQALGQPFPWLSFGVLLLFGAGVLVACYFRLLGQARDA